MPNFEIENSLNSKGFKKIVGIDEVGRGALVGPLIVCAVLFEKNHTNLEIFNLINDSKKLTDKKRRFIFENIKENIIYEFYEIDNFTIDQINILEANKLAVEEIIKIMKNKHLADFAIIDGNLKVNSVLPYLSIVKGDSKSYTIGLSSIFAKIYRDNIMIDLHKKNIEKGIEYG
jgi:ribonuclease HII